MIFQQILVGFETPFEQQLNKNNSWMKLYQLINFQSETICKKTFNINIEDIDGEKIMTVSNIDEKTQEI